MDFFSFLLMLGGLALFLYGMKTMGDALSKMAGSKLEQLLERMTNNPIKAVLLGTVVTTVIQSSSATTVMVVGFVNSGIMRLSQAIGVIMGANIGTTVTSWILSLSGIEGNSFMVRLLKPTSFSPVLALIGVVFLMFAKSEKKKDIGTILVGFAILMFGMGAVKPLANVPEFARLFVLFENPILGMLVGAALTAIIQSSSASVGILQAMCATGSVSFAAAVPVIMGQNIGTCVTAMISGIGANKNARRAALVHLYFNIVGTILFMAGFYSLNAFVKFSFLDDSATGASIALVHSVFNIASTLVLLPASKLLERLAYLTIPKLENEEIDTQVELLDERLLESPAFAVAQCKSAVCDMAQQVERSVGLCMKVQQNYDDAAVKQVMEIEDKLDVYEDALSTYLTKLSTKSLTERESHAVGKFNKCITDWERISDYAKGIAYTQRKLYQEGEHFSEKATLEAQVFFAAAQEIVELTVQCFVHEDAEQAICITPLADHITKLKRVIRENHNARLAKGECSVELGMALTDMVTSFERIAKHCTNIAEEELAEKMEDHAFHQYAKHMKADSKQYQKLLADYEKRYYVESA